jgi:hypothetical protein
VSVSAVGLLISAYAIGVVVGASTLTAVGVRFIPRQTLIALMVVFVVWLAVFGGLTPAPAAPVRNAVPQPGSPHISPVPG